MKKFDKSKVKLELTKKLSKIFSPSSTNELQINQKPDKSVVTDIDLFVSEMIKQELLEQKEIGYYHFFSEEEYNELLFPAAILDPIDGTRELVQGRDECAVSLALMNSPKLSDEKNYGWIFNPFSGFDLSSDDCFFPSKNKENQPFLGMVSRTEFNKGHYKNFLIGQEKIQITPRGSIAFKLGLLASGACDFVISLSPKNIWDIAAGTVLCHKRNIRLYQNGVEVKDLSKIHIEGILLWALPEVAEYLWSQFNNEKKG